MNDTIREKKDQLKQYLNDADELLIGVLQDYFRMELEVHYPDNTWKEPFERQVNEGYYSDYSNSYSGAWEKIQDKGIDNYGIEDMDVTIIVAILKARGPFDNCCEKKVSKKLDGIRNSRNEITHFATNPDANPDAEELADLSKAAIKACQEFTKAVVGLRPNETKVALTERRNYQVKYRDPLKELKGKVSKTFREYCSEEEKANQETDDGVASSEVPVDKSDEKTVDNKEKEQILTIVKIPGPELGRCTLQVIDSVTGNGLTDDYLCYWKAGNDKTQISENPPERGGLIIDREEVCFGESYYYCDVKQIKGTLKKVVSLNIKSELLLESDFKTDDAEPGSDKPALDGSASITREKESGKMALRLNRENGEVEVEQLLYFWCVSNEPEKPDQDGYKIGGPFFELEQEHIGKYVHGYISSKGYSGTLDAKRGPITREDLLLDINGSLKIKPNIDENGKPFVRARLSKSNPDTVFMFSWSVDGEELAEESDILYLSRDYINKKIRCKVTAKDRNGERKAEYLVEDSLFPTEAITAGVSVDLHYERNSDGIISDAYLEASVEECNIQNPILIYDWFADNIPVADAHESKFIVSADKHINKTIRCDVHFEGYEEIFSADHLVTEEELVISQPQPDPTPGPIEDPKPTPEPEPIPEPELEAVIPKHVLFEPAEARDYKATRYFQSIRGQIQYFACNYDDSYVLNSYEKMDYSHFLYRFLKEQGFERVVTIDKWEGKFDLFAFDKLSELSFANPAEFRNVTRSNYTDRLDQNSLKRFYDKLAEGRPTLTRPGKAALSRSSRSSESSQSSSADTTAEFGKRRINLPSITGKEIFQSTVSQYICPALRASNAKTCIVIPLGLLVTNEYLTPEIASLITSALNDAKKEVANNVLLITASRTEDFNAIMEQSYSLFSELEPEINKAYVNAGNGERFGTVLVKRLIEENRILISEECPRADEIANILLKKTLIDKEPSFKELPTSKIYTLSDYMYKSEEFNSSVNEILGLPEGTNKLTIDFIENILANKRITEALVEKSEELKDRQPVKYNNLPSAYLSRVIGEVERSIISKAERDEELNSILLEMDELVGMEAVKIQVLEQMNSMESDLRRLREGKIKVLPYQNMMFVGPPGTGKTTVAQLVARLMCAKGILPKETTVVRTPAHYNNTGTVGALKDALQADIESAAGGVILFDEFYNFNQGHSAGNMANDALAAIMEGADKYKGRICIIIAGYEKQVMDTLAFNPGAERRFPSINKITFTSYSTPDIVEIFRRQVVSSGFKEPDESVLRAIEPIIEAEKAEKRDEFANAGFVTDTLFPAIRRKYDSSNANNDVITVQHVIKAFPSFWRIIMSPGNAVDDILAEFDELVGMESVKEQIIEQMEVMKFNLREYRNGISSELPHQNMMFVGPQGTGKTTVATLVARLFAASGILPKRTPIIRTPKYYNNIGTVGVLGDALQKDIDSAEGGVILFDEFYNFNQGHSAGNMANDALAAIMDGADRYKGRICIIIAGYEKQVMDTLAFNPGAERRFPNKISFTSFSTADVVEIFRRYAISNNFKEPGKDVLDAITVVVENEKKVKGDRFTNGGFVTDKLFEAVKRKYIMRKGTDYILTVGDVHEAFPNDSAEDPVGQNKIYTRPSRELFAGIEGDKFESVKDIKDFKKLSRNAILRINTSAGKVGTAFLIHPDGYAVTCNHVIADNNNIEAETITATLRFFSGNKSISENVEAIVLMRDPHLDMAIVKIDPQNECITKMMQSMELDHLPYLRVADERDELDDLTGEKSIICGFPNAKETAQARTIEISGMTKNPAKIDCYATSDNAYGGDSGAPIILADSRRVIGILKGSLKDKDGRGYEGDNFIIPIHYFWKDMVK